MFSFIPHKPGSQPGNDQNTKKTSISHIRKHHTYKSRQNEVKHSTETGKGQNADYENIFICRMPSLNQHLSKILCSTV